MSQSRSAKAEKQTLDDPFLIVDKEGTIAEYLAHAVQDSFITVVVSKYTPPVHHQMVHIPFRQAIPVIPDNKYSYLVVVYQGEKELLSSLPSFAEKAQANNAPLLFLISTHLATTEVVKTVHQAYNRITLIIYGDLYGNEKYTSSLLSQLLSEQAIIGTLLLPNAGILESYPVFFPDLIESITQLCFGTNPKPSVALLLPSHAYSAFALGRAIQHVYPETNITLGIDEIEQPTYFIPKEGEYMLNETPLEEALRLVPPQVIQMQTPIPKKKKRARRAWMPKHVKVSVSVTLLLLIVLLVAPLLIGGVFAWRGIANAKKGNITQSTRDISHALPFLTVSDHELTYAIDILPLPILQSGEKKLTIINQGLNALRDSLTAATDLSHGLMGSGSLNRDAFESDTAALAQGALLYESLVASGEVPKQFISASGDTEKAINTFLSLRPILPALFGYEGKRTYLVLFENNMELRPGGGFIGSYGLLTVDKGKMSSFQIHNVYDADGQLKGHVDPPFAVSRYLGASHWYLRDSNASVDGKVNTESELRFLTLETGQHADGVIAITVTFLQQLLGVTGPIVLPNYNQTITKDNFYLLTQQHAEKNFFPGSTQKQDFLGYVSSKLEAQLFHPKQTQFLSLIRTILAGFQQKQVLLDTLDPTEQSLLTLNNINNALSDTRTTQNQLNDFLGIRETNVGQNKVNYYLTRSITQSVQVSQSGEVSDTVTAEYHNGSNVTSAFGGVYKAYVQFIVPSGATLTHLQLNDQETPFQDAITDQSVYKSPGFIAPATKEIERSDISGKTVLGIYLEVPQLSSLSVSMTYTLAQIVSPTDATIYSLSLSKQPGTGSDQYSFNLTFPTYRVLEKDASFRQAGDRVVYNGTLATDKTLQLQLSQ